MKFLSYGNTPFPFFVVASFAQSKTKSQREKILGLYTNILLSSTIFSFFVDFWQPAQLVHGMPILNCALSPLPKKAK